METCTKSLANSMACMLWGRSSVMKWGPTKAILAPSGAQLVDLIPTLADKPAAFLRKAGVP